MIVSLAQVQPKYGDIAYNLASQETFIRQSAELGAEMIIFPELSITGYEPSLARELAIDTRDPRLQMFQELADQLQITIITSAPLKPTEGITISLLIYQTGTPVQVYSKQYLHADEKPYFVPEKCEYEFESGAKIGLAICYELSVNEHVQSYLGQGLDLYIASSAKTAKGSKAAHERLSKLAAQYGIMTFFVNSIGLCDGVICAGQSSAWNHQGQSIGVLSADSEGLLIIDTTKQDMIQAIDI